MAREIVVNLSSNRNYWQADWRGSLGLRRKRSLGPKSELSARQARKLCQQLANEFNRKPGAASNNQIPGLGEYLAGYIKSRTELKPATLYLFELTAKYLKRFFGESTSIDKLTRQGARDWRTALARGDFSDGRPMADVSVCHRCGDAKTMFKRAVEDDVLPLNPFDRLKVRAPKPDKDWYYVSQGDLEKLFAACNTIGWKVLIALCRLAGLRRGEALSLPWSGIDWQNRRLTVFAEKTGEKRIVPIDPMLYPLLEEARQARLTDQTRVCDVNPHCLWRNFNVIRKRAGLPAWKDAFQVMRRNRETDWAQQYPQYAVSEWIGHDITVSATHYLQVPEELFRKAAGSQIGTTSEAVSAQSAPKSAPKTPEVS
jgi:integrase